MLSAELVLVDVTLHEPIAVDANQVEPVKALLDPDQVLPTCEALLLLILVVREFLKTNGAAAKEGIIVLGQDFSERLVNVVQHPGFKLGIFITLAVFFQSFLNVNFDFW